MATTQSVLEIQVDDSAPGDDAREPIARFNRGLPDRYRVDFEKEQTDDGIIYRYTLEEGEEQGSAREIARKTVQKSEHVKQVRYNRQAEPQPPETDEVTTKGDPSSDDVVPRHCYQQLRQSYDNTQKRLKQAEDDLEARTNIWAEDVKALEDQLDRIGAIVGTHPSKDEFYNTLEDRLEAEPSVDEQATHAKNSETNANFTKKARSVDAGAEEIIAYSQGPDAFRKHWVRNIEGASSWQEATQLGRAYLAKIVRDGYKARLDDQNINPDSLDDKQRAVDGLRAALQGQPHGSDSIKDNLHETQRQIQLIQGYRRGSATYNKINPSHDDLEQMRNLVEDIEQRRHAFDDTFNDLGTVEATYAVTIGDDPMASLDIPGTNTGKIQAATWGVLIDEMNRETAKIPANQEFTGQPLPLQNTAYDTHKNIITNVKDRLSKIGIDATITYDYGRQTTI